MADLKNIDKFFENLNAARMCLAEKISDKIIHKDALSVYIFSQYIAQHVHNIEATATYTLTITNEQYLVIRAMLKYFCDASGMDANSYYLVENESVNENAVINNDAGPQNISLGIKGSLLNSIAPDSSAYKKLDEQLEEVKKTMPELSFSFNFPSLYFSPTSLKNLLQDYGVPEDFLKDNGVSTDAIIKQLLSQKLITNAGKQKKTDGPILYSASPMKNFEGKLEDFFTKNPHSYTQGLKGPLKTFLQELRKQKEKFIDDFSTYLIQPYVRRQLDKYLKGYYRNFLGKPLIVKPYQFVNAIKSKLDNQQQLLEKTKETIDIKTGKFILEKMGKTNKKKAEMKKAEMKKIDEILSQFYKHVPELGIEERLREKTEFLLFNQFKGGRNDNIIFSGFDTSRQNTIVSSRQPSEVFKDNAAGIKLRRIIALKLYLKVILKEARTTNSDLTRFTIPINQLGKHISEGIRLPGLFQSETIVSIYEQFIPVNEESITIGDPCMGWGNRLVASFLYQSLHSPKKVKYFGTDPQYKSGDYKAAMNTLNKNLEERSSNWSSELHGLPAEKEELFANKNTTFDIVFTSPPYFTVEKYPGENQSHALYKDRKLWTKGFLLKMFQNFYSRLKPGGMWLLNYYEGLGRKNCIPNKSIISTFFKNEVVHSSLVNIAFLTSGSNGFNPEYIFIFKKIDTIPKKLSPKLKEMEIKEIASRRLIDEHKPKKRKIASSVKTTGDQSMVRSETLGKRHKRSVNTSLPLKKRGMFSLSSTSIKQKKSRVSSKGGDFELRRVDNSSLAPTCRDTETNLPTLFFSKKRTQTVDDKRLTKRPHMCNGAQIQMARD